jgi:HK97 family phage prohead protease
MTHRRLQATNPGQLLVAAAGPVSSDDAARTITGRLVPYGQVGSTNMGRFTFAAGSITVPDDPSEVKLLVEHDQVHSVGYATALEERPDGLWGTFHVPAGDPEGDLALRRAANRVRNAFSVGVDLDSATLETARRSRDGKPVAARGALRETSLVSVPAFQGARVTDVAASSSHLVVAAWSDLNPSNGRTPMFCTHCGQAAHPNGTPCPTLQAAGITTQTAAAPPTQAPAPVVTHDQLQAAIAGLLGVPEAQAQAQAPETPAAVPAAAGQARATASTQVTAEPPTYTFGGDGPGFIRDAWLARTEGNAEAAARLSKFGQELQDGGPVVSRMIEAAGGRQLLTAAVETTSTAPQIQEGETFRPDLLVRAIDRGRPMFSAMRNVRLTNATPFRVPVEGEFTGVGAHTEGTAHVAEGDLALDSTMVEPGAISGAYRFTRELADSTNPAIDGIALRAMLRDYRRGSEAMVAAALAVKADGVTAKEFADELVDTGQELRAQVIAHALANDTIPAEFGFLGGTAYELFANLEASDGRPYFPPVNPHNAAGTSDARRLSLSVDNTPLTASTGIDTAHGYLVNEDDVLVGESGILSFRFDQPEGPGIIKLALWGYQVAHVMRDAGVRRFSTADEA